MTGLIRDCEAVICLYSSSSDDLCRWISSGSGLITVTSVDHNIYLLSSGVATDLQILNPRQIC